MTPRTIGALGAMGALGALGAWLVWRRRPPEADASPVVDNEVEALARVITSEAARYTEAERRAIAWTARNRAAKRKTTIARLVCTPCGPQGRSRPFSTARAASDVDRELAREVLDAPASADPTKGALAFFEPRVQDRLVAEGRPGYRFTSAEVRARWIADGQRPTGTVGAFEFFT